MPGLRGILYLGRHYKSCWLYGVAVSQVGSPFLAKLLQSWEQVPVREFSMLLVFLLLSKSIKSRVKPVCLRCSLLIPLSRPCLYIEDRLSLTDGKPAAVLRLAAKWDRGGAALMVCGIELKGYEHRCTMEGNEWGPSWGNSIFRHWMSVLKVCEREKAATGQGADFCHIPVSWFNLHDGAATSCCVSIGLRFLNSVFFWPQN